MAKPVTEEEVKEMQRLLNQGFSPQQIAKKIGRSAPSVYKYLGLGAFWKRP